MWKIPPDLALRLVNSPFCISDAVMGFLIIPLSRKDFNTKESRELVPKFLIPFLLQTSLSLSYLLHNSMSHKNYLERPQKKANKKKKIKQEKLEGTSLMISFTLSIYSVSEWRQTLEVGLGDVPPLHLFQPDRKYIRNMCLFGAESTS